MFEVGLYDERKGRKRTIFFTGLIGAIIGAILILFALPALERNGILSSRTESSNEEGNNISAERSVSIDVTTDITKAVDKVSDAVVGVVNIQKNGFWEDESESSEAGTGSGVLYKKSGNKAYLVTNYHVIEGANEIEVSLKDGSRIAGKVRGGDDLTDLAVIEIDGKNIKTLAEFGDSDRIKAGEPAIAIGNPLGLQFAGSVTQGIISGTNRLIPQDLNNDGNPDWQAEVIQTDAAINPGNSGGALINVAGKVIGINSMKIAEDAVEGIGLSIPINTARPFIEDLEKDGEVHRPYIGVSTLSLSQISGYHLQETLKLPKGIVEGVAVLRVSRLSPAAKAGMKEYDVIVEMEGKRVRNIIDLRKYLYQKGVNDKLDITFYRNGKKKNETLKLVEEPK
ncbi:S1C family serine protease [Priestia endophytica]|jgi:serine protease Do|nr:S1C family serine protease [Priestia endophytica]MED4071546.1 S1C family serine protease [Priestia endophytica]